MLAVMIMLIIPINNSENTFNSQITMYLRLLLKMTNSKYGGSNSANASESLCYAQDSNFLTCHSRGI